MVGCMDTAHRHALCAIALLTLYSTIEIRNSGRLRGSSVSDGPGVSYLTELGELVPMKAPSYPETTSTAANDELSCQSAGHLFWKYNSYIGGIASRCYGQPIQLLQCRGESMHAHRNPDIGGGPVRITTVSRCGDLAEIKTASTEYLVLSR